jgi:pimeloyl-ACP methyl ester carboxylesterase
MSDHLHHCHIVREGQRLARQVRNLRERRPDLPIYLVGHSAGCAIVLAAGDGLSPDSVERIILLAPSVSTRYDLRPALSCSRQGIDAFTSRSDWWVLGFGMWISGTTDRRWAPAAGRVGFQQVGTDPRDEALYARLHQHPWDPSWASTGHNGGHYGSFEDAFLRVYVLPLLNVREGSKGANPPSTGQDTLP